MQNNDGFVSVRGHFRDGKWRIAVAYKDGTSGLGFGGNINDAVIDATRNAGRGTPYAESGDEAP